MIALGKDGVALGELVGDYTDTHRAGMAEGIGFALERVIKLYLENGAAILGDVAEDIAHEAVRILGDAAREEFKRRNLTIISCAKADGEDPT